MISKKKKSLRFTAARKFPHSNPKSRWSIKKVFPLNNGGYFNLGARGKNFQKLMLSEKKKERNSWCPLKKKVFTSISSLISPFFSRNQGVLWKKKRSSLRIALYILNKHLQRIETVCAIFEGGPQKKGGLRRLPHLPQPISTTAS